MSRLGRRALWGVLAWLACAPGGLDVAGLEARHPELRRIEDQRLGDARPYYWPRADTLTLFLCRWPDGARIPVSLSEGISDAERRQLQAALDLWEGAGLGVSFELRPKLGAEGIEIRLLDELMAGAANTVAECALDASAADGDPLPARIVFASIHLGRGDPLLTEKALHELGHALGYQGHAARGRTVMGGGSRHRRSEGARATGEAKLRDAAVGALYAVPSGSVLARRPLPAGRSRDVDRLLALAPEHGLLGPWLRVGDREARIAWIDRSGAAVSLRLSGLAAARRDPARLAVEPSARAERLLSASP